MKKITVMIMVAIIICMTSACDGLSLKTFIDNESSPSEQSSSEVAAPTSALEACKEADRKMEELYKTHAVELVLDANMNVSVSGQSQSVTISGTGVMNEINNIAAMNMAVNMPALGVSMNTAWYCDGISYYTWLAGKTYRLPLDETTKSEISSADGDLDYENLVAESETLNKAENGGYDYTIVVSLGSLSQDAKNSMLKIFNLENSDVNIKTMTISGNIGTDGIFASECIAMSVESTTEGVTTPMDMNMNFKYDIKDEGYQITVPELIDIENAIDSDSSILGEATQAA